MKFNNVKFKYNNITSDSHLIQLKYIMDIINLTSGFKLSLKLLFN